ncbi:peptidase C15, pyroglutamyl peptidase I-like protein [Trichoderma longibrachiatum ATCC 18648]|uniref:Peptidase C15, pyroglutamyl peptidase I-like protein n=1 Tax=Trichoderma longibrachiatum ATCC 18648 TaxID=983965 RepID=A0A2T4CJ01_TRILO|nr:peptidase C15, pyroglutamyl peptidase I-like protein [Trichoderma longibrachiatum ATCC 18648]
MGSQVDEELTVLVTGFQPFRSEYPINPSWEIAKGLPEYLPPRRAKDPDARHAVDIPPVRILVHPEPLRVSYKVVRETVPTIWQETYQDRKIDIVIHIGMAGPRLMYQIESRGHRTGYKARDVDGRHLDELEGKRNEEWVWHDLPDELRTDLDIDDIWERWLQHTPGNLDLRISDDAGRYLCDFIYYSSLASCYKQGKERKVIFLHVPADGSEAVIKQGQEVAVNLIRSIVESEVYEETMCRSAVCSTCKKQTWWGCGKHIPSVLDSVPEDSWCTCEPKVERDGKAYPPMATQPS